jgi:transposase
MERRKYSKEFKLGAARMVVDEKKSCSQVARDLGVSDPSVGKWVRAYRRSGGGAFPGKGKLTPEDDRLHKLERENRLLKMERDLLKKTMVLFVGPDRTSMQQ